MTAVEVLVQGRSGGRWKRRLAWVWLVSNVVSMPGSRIGDRLGYATMALACVWYLQGPRGRQ